MVVSIPEVPATLTTRKLRHVSDYEEVIDDVGGLSSLDADDLQDRQAIKTLGNVSAADGRPRQFMYHATGRSGVALGEHYKAGPGADDWFEDLTRLIRPNAYDFDLIPNQLGESAANLTKFITAVQYISSRGGGALYFPRGTWYLSPVNKAAGLAENDMRYVALVGDGSKATTISLPSGHSEALFDFNDLNYFDVHMAGITFNGGGNAIPHVMRFNSGGRHYRVKLFDCWFRNFDVAGDGLLIDGGQLFELSMCYATNLGGWGFRFDSAIGVRGYVDVEQCATGGVLFEKTNALRDYLDNRLSVYSEQAQADVRFDGTNGCAIEGINGNRTVEFRNGARGNLVRGTNVTADFASGAHSNIVEGWQIISTGVDARLNVVGVPNSTLPFEVPNTVLPTTDPDHLRGTTNRLYGGSLSAGNYLLRFWAGAITATGDPRIQVSVERGSLTYDFKDRTFKSSGATSVRLGVDGRLRRYHVPFVTDQSDTFTVRIILLNNTTNTAQVRFYDADTVLELYQARFAASKSSNATFAALTMSGEFRFESTIRFRGTATDEAILGIGSGLSNIVVGSSTTIKVGFVSGGQSTFTVPAMSADVDYLLRVQRDASNDVRVFLDDVESSTGAVNRTQAFTVDRLGFSQFTNYLDGRVYNAKIWSDEAGTTLIHHWFDGTQDLSDQQGSKDLTWTRERWELIADLD